MLQVQFPSTVHITVFDKAVKKIMHVLLFLFWRPLQFPPDISADWDASWFMMNDVYPAHGPCILILVSINHALRKWLHNNWLSLAHVPHATLWVAFTQKISPKYTAAWIEKNKLVDTTKYKMTWSRRPMSIAPSSDNKLKASYQIARSTRKMWITSSSFTCGWRNFTEKRWRHDR